MNRRRILLAIGAVVFAACGGLFATRATAQQRVEQRFDELDRNGDSKVTPDELPAAAFFKRLDLDGDGAITKPEAVEAVRKGALQGLRGLGRGGGSAASGTDTDATTPAKPEPPVREGPKPVRPGDHGIGRHVGDLTFTDLEGTSRSLAEIAAGKIAVFAMTSTSCPLSRKYLPRLAEMSGASGDRVAWILVNPVATDKPADMQAAAAELGGQATYVHDGDGRLAAALGAVTTTDVVVLAIDRTVAYHGAIDDQYGFGYAIDAPRRRYLADALAAIQAGERPLVAATEAPGCVLDRPADGPPAAAVTYHGRISRIVAQHCVECHRDGGVGPFPLDSYDDLVAHAGMVGQVIDRGTMPPWFAAPTPADPETGRVHSPWANDRSLAEAEKRDLREWLAGGRPLGDPADAPAARAYPEGWQIGVPDAVFEFAEPVAVKATGVMPYQTVIVETRLPEDRWVQAIEVQPGDRNVVHHALIHLAGADDEGADDPRDEAARERGGFWGEYVPGQNTLVYPAGYAKKLPRGARLRFQMHYTPNGKATTDRTRVGVIYAKEPPEHEVRVAGIVNPRISIPPGAADHREEASLRLPFDATVMGFLPHLHVRGKACRYELIRADGGRTTLLDIPRYDFNWQLLYRRHEPLALQAGDTLVFTAWYDNSAGNPANPDPTQTVRWGPQTFDEMHLGYVEYFVPGVAPGDPQPRLRRGLGGGASGAEPSGSAADRIQPTREQAEAIRRLRERVAALPVPEGLERRTIRVGDLEREYFLHVPGKVAGMSAPVVFALHGGAANSGLQMHLKVDYTPVADKEGFVVVYPSGLAGWNAGGPGAVVVRRRTSDADDLGFFRALFDALVKEGVADPKRIYVTGGSNGGVMAQYLACAMPERIAGIGVVVATLPKAADSDWPKPSLPVPTILMLGTEDRFMPYDGSGGQRSAAETAAFWRTVNDCTDEPVRRELPDRDPADGCRVRVESWAGRAPVVLSTLEGHGHGWPMQRGKSDTGPKTRDISAPEELWAFLQDKTR